MSLNTTLDYGFLSPSPVDSEIEQHRQIVARLSETTRSLNDAKVRLHEAQRADKDAAAVAFAAGRNDPGTPKADAVSMEITDLERRVAAGQQAVATSHAHLMTRISEATPAWLDAVEVEKAQTLRDLDAALSLAASHLDNLDRLGRVAAFLEQPTDKAFRKGGLPGVIKVKDVEADARLVLAALADYRRVERPAPQPAVFNAGE